MFEKQVVIKCDYDDIEDLINKHYSDKLIDYSFISTEECGNDSTHRFRVDGKLDNWDKKQIKKGLPSNYAILNMLCKDGYIEAGEYIVSVCW